MGFISAATGGYYEGDRADHLDIAVPDRPDFKHIFVDGAWAPAPPTTADVDAFRNARLATGFVDGSTGKIFPCDDSSLIKWGGLGSSAGLAVVTSQPGAAFSVWGMDNQPITLTAAQAFALFNGRLLPWVSATMAHARDLKNLILAGTPPADITLGWP